MFIVVHEDNEYKETLINVKNIHFIRKVSEIIDPKYPNIKTLIGIDDGPMAMGVIEDYESIKNYIAMQQPNGFYVFEQKSNVSYYEDIRFKLKQFLIENYNIKPSLSEKTVEEMFKRGTEFISLEEQKESENKDKNKKASDTLTVTFDSSLYDLAGICISRTVNGKDIILKAEVGEQADILYYLLTEQTAKAEIKESTYDE